MAAGSESCRPEAVPKGAAPEVAKVLQASSWYAVLDVLPSATVEEIRKAHKVKSLVTHPDKLGAKNSGAHEASVRVNTVGLPCFSLLRLAPVTSTLTALAACYGPGLIQVCMQMCPARNAGKPGPTLSRPCTHLSISCYPWSTGTDAALTL